MVKVPRRSAIERAADDAVLTPLEAEAVLEIGYLAMVADGPMKDEEVEGFGHVAPRLLKRALGESDLEKLVEGFSDALVRVGIEERLTNRVACLAGPAARRSAYRVASALTLCDLASNESENAFDELLVRALGLTDAEADALAMDAYSTITVA